MSCFKLDVKANRVENLPLDCFAIGANFSIVLKVFTVFDKSPLRPKNVYVTNALSFCETSKNLSAISCVLNTLILTRNLATFLK
jgi:hypothetical protein